MDARERTHRRGLPGFIGRAIGAAILAAIVAILPAQVLAATQTVTAGSEPNAFDAARLTVAVGDTVRWVIGPGNVHTVTSGTYNASGVHPDGLFDSGSLAPGAEFAFTFSAPGEFPYVCAIHADSGMVGRIVVTSEASPGPDRTAAPPVPGDGEPAPPGAIAGVLVALALAATVLIAAGWRLRAPRA